MLPHKHSMMAICLWISISIGFFFWRLSTPFVWSDTPLIANNLYEETEPLVWKTRGIFRHIIDRSFYDVGADGYRPLSRIILWVGTALFSDRQVSPDLWFAVVGVIIGALAVCFFLVARRFLRSDAAALYAVVLFLFSTPFVSASWVVFSGIQALVPLLICLGLLLYWKVVESPQYKSWYIAGLCAVLFFGPWFREFIGLLPLLIIFLEAQRARRPTILMSIAGLFFLHAIYPAALVKLTVYPNLPLHPVFAMGHLGSQINPNMTDSRISLIAQLLSLIKWAMPFHFLTLYPPVLFVFALIALLLPVINIGSSHRTDHYKDAATVLIKQKHIQHKLTGILREFFFPLLFLIGLIGLYIYNQFGFALWLCFGLVLLGLRRDAFLAWWFLLFFIPFLRVFTEQVHLAYALLPASIIIVTVIEDLWQVVRPLDNFFRVVRYALVLGLIVATGDHLLNAYSSYRVVHSINGGILKMADWFKSYVPAGSIVVSNALHAEDIRLFSNGHIKVLWTVHAGIARDKDAVAEPVELEQLLEEKQGKHDVYFLDMDFNYTPDKVGYHSHKYVRNHSVSMEEVGLIHTTQARYPYLDPLKAFISRPYISFLGAPDLENDFYRGPAQDGTPFLREVYAEYHVYRVTGTKVSLWDSNGPLKMVKEGYRGFNILDLNGRFFAIPQADGAFDLKKVWKKEYSSSFISDSYEDIFSQIDTALSNNRLPADPTAVQFTPLSIGNDAGPILIEEGYKGFNFVRYEEMVYAIPLGEGAFDIDRIRSKEYSHWFISGSVEEIKRQIDQLPVDRAQHTYKTPKLVEEGYKSFNIILYDEKVYGLAQDEGAFDIEKANRKKYHRFFVGNSVDEIKNLVDQSLRLE